MKKLTLLIVTVFAGVTLFAQDPYNNEAYVNQTGENGQAYVTQDGTVNYALVNQYGEEYVDGLPNITIVDQLGDGNYVTVDVSGSGNYANIDITGGFNGATDPLNPTGGPASEQMGENNVLYVTVVGDMNDGSTVQTGVSNDMMLYINGNENRYELIQDGMNNEDDVNIMGDGNHVLTDQYSPDMGNKALIRIRGNYNGWLGDPVEVLQNGNDNEGEIIQGDEGAEVDFNNACIIQVGDDNYAMISQNAINVGSTEDNYARIHTYGDNNELYVEQKEWNNTAWVKVNNGDNNYGTSYTDGYMNDVDVNITNAHNNEFMVLQHESGQYNEAEININNGDFNFAGIDQQGMDNYAQINQTGFIAQP